MSEVRISPGDGDSSQAALSVGDVLAVELSENATTGYVWSAAAVPEQLAELPGDADAGEAALPPGDAARAGGGGRRLLRFAAQQPGAGELRLRHGRPWQAAAGDDLTITVHVAAAP